MNAADAHNLAVSQFNRIVSWCDSADNDESADPWLYLEDIRNLCQDTLVHLEDVKR